MSLAAPWQADPATTLHEAAEFLASEDDLSGTVGEAELFWKFVDAVALAEEKHEPARVLEAGLADLQLAGLSEAVLRTAIAAGAHSPAVELNHQQAMEPSQRCGAEAGAFAVVGKLVRSPAGLLQLPPESAKIACQAGDLEGALEAAAAVDAADGVQQQAATAVTLTSSDHVHPFSDTEPSMAVVLFAHFTDASFAEFHGAAAEAAGQPGVAYVLRHWLGQRRSPASAAADGVWGTATLLGGYGVGLDIKKMDYKVLDDREQDEEAQAVAAGFEQLLGRADVAGAAAAAAAAAAAGAAVPSGQAGAVGEDQWVSAGMLELLHGDEGRRSALDVPSAALPGLAPWLGAGFPAELQATNVSQLGLQLTSFLMRHHAAPEAATSTKAGSVPLYTAASRRPDSSLGGPTPDPLDDLDAVLRDFPTAAPAVGRFPVSKRVRRGVRRQNTQFAAGRNFVLVNGRVVDVTAASFNYFGLLRTLQEEAAALGRLEGLPVSASAKARLRASASKSVAGQDEEEEGATGNGGKAKASRVLSGQGPLRVDFRKGAKGSVAWMNNIQKDKQYAKWPRSLRGLMQASWQLPQIRKNIFTTVIGLDPSTPEGMRALGQANQVLQAGVGIRMGLVFTNGSEPSQALCSADEPLSLAKGAVPATGAHIGVMFHALATQHGAAAARTFVLSLATEWQAQVQERMQAAQMRVWQETQDQQAAMQAAYAVDPGSIRLTVDDCAEAWAIAAQTAAASSSLGALEAAAKATLADHAARAAFCGGEQYLEGLGLSAPVMVMNGRVASSLDIQAGLMPLVSSDLQELRGLLHNKKINDKSNVIKTLMRVSGALPRFYRHIVGDGSQSDRSETLVPLASGWARPVLDPSATSFFESPQTAGAANASTPAVTLLAAVDLSLPAGLRAATGALAAVAAANGSEEATGLGAMARVGVVHTGAADDASAARLVAGLAAIAGCEDCSAAAKAPAAYAWLHCRGDSTCFAGEEAIVGAAAVAAAAAVGRPKTTPASTWAGAGAAQRLLAAADIAAPQHAGAVLANGRAVPIRTEGGGMDAAEAEVLVAVEVRRRAGAVVSALGDELNDRGGDQSLSAADLVAVASAAVGEYTALGDRVVLPERPFASNATTFVSMRPAALGPPSGVEVEAILDPISVTAQRVAPLLRVMRDAIGARVTVRLNPTAAYAGEDLPLKSYFRFVAPGAQPLDRSDLRPKRAEMGLLPSGVTLTAKVYPPEPWNVQSLFAPVDGDNAVLQPAASGGAVELGYQLRHVLVAGQCSEEAPEDAEKAKAFKAGGAGMTGLQLDLRQPSRPADAPLTDTLVMRNLGYFQLKAPHPADLAVSIAPGRSAEVMEMVAPRSEALRLGHLRTSAGSRGGGGGSSGLRGMLGPRGGAVNEDDPLVPTPYLPISLRDFSGRVLQLRVRKRAGQEDRKLLLTAAEEAAEAGAEAPAAGKSGSMWSALSSLWSSDEKQEERQQAAATDTSGGGDEVAAQEAGAVALPGGARSLRDDGRVHVFSLSSGWLYERMLRIMMTSVSRRCSRPVTFWLIENFLSPAFKSTIQKLADKEGFEVRLITYKWPNWLRGQTEQQRIIWGYKILFLDVLFPIDLPRVIYVDADQVVRGDLAELWDMDLEGKPYGYTPFCTSREETLGFQFWNQGYWKDHLQGRPYHISALYVVDLDVFRRGSVGDTLRATYDQLSRDPNSLANLDQDLPNYAQHQVPIHSLPQEWLWCESWCSDASKPAAKTIDLCNNPLHKEPKLDMARRVISGPLFEESWVQLDEQIAGALHNGASAEVTEDGRVAEL